MDVEHFLGRVSAAVETEQLEEATANLRQLVAEPDFLPDHFSSAVEGSVRTLLWKALLPAPATHRHDRALEHLLAIMRSMGFSSLIPICERILVGAIPEGELIDRLALLLEQAPHSSELLHASSRLGSEMEGDRTWDRHRLAAGGMYLRQRDLFRASRIFMGIIAGDPANKAASVGLDRVMALGTELAEVAIRFRSISAGSGCAADPVDAIASCKGFLARHPFYTPALEELAKLLASCGRHHEAVAVHLVLTKRALRRDETSQARAHLKKILAHDFENDDALLLLASLDVPAYDAPGELWKFRVSLLEREQLYRSAIYHARKQLTGEAVDFSALGILADLSRKAGKDPSPYLSLQGYMAWEADNLRIARDCFEAAIREARVPEVLVDELLQAEGIEAVISRAELLARKV